MERVHSNMDDFYLLNPDVIQRLGSEGELADLSGLKNAENLREVVITANTEAPPQQTIPFFSNFPLLFLLLSDKTVNGFFERLHIHRF